MRALALYSRRFYWFAEQALAPMSETFSDNGAYQILAAACSHAVGLPGAGLQCIERLPASYADLPAVVDLRLKLVEAASRLKAHRAELADAARAQDKWLRVRALMEGGFHVPALNACLDELKTNNDAFEPNYRAAQCYNAMRAFGEAVPHLERAIAQRSEPRFLAFLERLREHQASRRHLGDVRGGELLADPVLGPVLSSRASWELLYDDLMVLDARAAATLESHLRFRERQAKFIAARRTIGTSWGEALASQQPSNGGSVALEEDAKDEASPGDAALRAYDFFSAILCGDMTAPHEANAVRAIDRLVELGRTDLVLGIAYALDTSAWPAVSDKLQSVAVRFDQRFARPDRSTEITRIGGNGDVPTFRPGVATAGVESLLPEPHEGPGLRGENVSIVILSQNRVRLTLRLLRSISAAMPNFPGEILIFDNGSEPGVVERLEREAQRSELQTRIVRSPVNLGVGPGRNVAFQAVTKPWVLSLDNDMVCLADPFADAQRVFEKLGAKYINFPFLNPNDVTNYGVGKAWFVVNSDAGTYLRHGNAIDLNLQAAPERLSSGFFSNRVSGGAALYNGADFYARGGFDPAMKVGYEDTEFSIRLSKSGIYVGNVLRPYFFHAHVEATSAQDLATEQHRFDPATLFASAARMEAVTGLPMGDPSATAAATRHKRSRSSKSVYFAPINDSTADRKAVALVLPYLPGPLQVRFMRVAASLSANYELHVFYRHEFATGRRLMLNVAFADVLVLPEENADLLSLADPIEQLLAYADAALFSPPVLIVAESDDGRLNLDVTAQFPAGSGSIQTCRADEIAVSIGSLLAQTAR